LGSKRSFAPSAKPGAILCGSPGTARWISRASEAVHSRPLYYSRADMPFIHRSAA